MDNEIIYIDMWDLSPKDIDLLMRDNNLERMGIVIVPPALIEDK